MASKTAALITVASLCVGASFGSFLRTRLPESHLRDESRDVLKLASGVIATLVALVIGLLVSSSKATYDQAAAGATQIGARLILLNRLMERYGPETEDIRARLRAGIAANIEHLWPARGSAPNLSGIEQSNGMDEVHDLIARLEPKDEVHRVLRVDALGTCMDLAQSRWTIIEQAQGRLPTAFLAMLVFWLTVLFASLGLLAPRNATISCSLFVCALSMAGAIYLILEMNRPLEGVVQISPAPLQKAMSVIGGGKRADDRGAGLVRPPSGP